MRKIVKSAIVCDKCGSTLKNEEYEKFCDYCKMKVEGEGFNITIFHKDISSKDEQFCTVKCLKDFLLNFPYNKEEIKFITLPYFDKLEELQSFIKE